MAAVTHLDNATVTLDMVDQTVTRILMCVATSSHVFMVLPVTMREQISTRVCVLLATLVETVSLTLMSVDHFPA